MSTASCNSRWERVTAYFVSSEHNLDGRAELGAWFGSELEPTEMLRYQLSKWQRPNNTRRNACCLFYCKWNHHLQNEHHAALKLTWNKRLRPQIDQEAVYGGIDSNEKQGHFLISLHEMRLLFATSGVAAPWAHLHCLGPCLCPFCSAEIITHPTWRWLKQLARFCSCMFECIPVSQPKICTIHVECCECSHTIHWLCVCLCVHTPPAEV